MTVVTRHTPLDDARQVRPSTKPSPSGESSKVPVHKTLLQRPDWLPESVWPFQTFGLEMDHSTIAVTDVGQGPTLLFVHTGVWSFIWRDVIGRLSNDFRCVCFDAPGTGQSSRLPGNAITLERSARTVAAVIRCLELQNFTLVMHDLGGPAGLAGAASTAERVRGIVGVNCFGWRPTGALFRGMLALMGSTPIRELDVRTEFLTRITSTNFGIGRHMDSASRQAFRAGIDRQGRRAFHYYMRDARNCDRLYRDVEQVLSGPFKSLPLMTIFGERNDPLGFQPKWRVLFPSARQIVVAGGNHFPMCDDPELVADAIRSWHVEQVSPNRADQTPEAR
jgi:pimeloyl-ACP methyl ester carboxylesterase